MQVVIDITEELYNEIKRQSAPLPHLDILRESVLNGKILPEGHGKIIDASKIEWFGCTLEQDCLYTERECKNCSGANCYRRQVDNIPAIVEADRGDSE